MSEMRLTAPPERRAAGFCRAWFGAACLVVVAAITITVWARHAGKSVRPTNVTVLYVGAEDCAPCRAWQKGEGASFLASADFARVTYREVKSPHLLDILRDEYWPEEIRSYRNDLRLSDGVPLWLVVADHQIVEQRFGAAEWRAKILPKIKSLLH